MFMLGRLAVAAALMAALSGPSLGQTTFPTANGSSVPGAVMMCFDSATGLAAPVLVTGNTCPTGSGGGGGGAVTMASGAVASGAYSSGSIASGAFASGALSSGSVASGAFASGAVASGAYASGSIGSGAMVDLGAIADAAATAGSTGTVSAKLRLATTQLGTLATNQTGGTQKTQIVDGSGSVIASTSNALNAFVTNATPGIANNADGIAAVAASATSPVPVNNYAYVWNGSTWDRMAGTTAGVTVRSPTAANFNATIVGTGTLATQAALTAGEVHVGEVSSNQTRVDVAQTVTASSAYTSGNAIGGLMTIANAARVSGSLGAAGTGGIIQQVVANSKSLQTTQVDVFLFNSNPSGSTCTDKTAFVLATADFDKVIGVASIPGTAANNSGWFGGGTGSVGQANNLAMAFDLASGTSVFACAVTRGTPTFTATSDISFKYQILRN